MSSKDKVMQPTVKLIFFIFLYISVTATNATHIRGGFIHIEQKDINSLEMTITINIYQDISSIVPVGSGVIDFGDGSDPVTIPDLPYIPLPEFGRDIGISTYTITHTYSTAGLYIISYTEPYRNAEISNLTESIVAKLHLETTILIDPEIDKVNTSKPIQNTFMHFHLDQVNSLALTMQKINKEIYVYHLITPMMGRGMPVEYRLPYNVNVDPVTGVFTWDLTKEDPEFKDVLNNISAIYPGHEGPEFSFAALANQYQLVDGELVKTSETLLDFQIIVLTPTEEVTSLGEENEYVVENNQTVNIEKAFAAYELPEITVAADLPQDSYDYTIDNEIDSKPKSAIVNIQLNNSSIETNGPYFFVIRSKLGGNFKDEVITIYSNEKYEYPYNIITSINDVSENQTVIYPNPSSGNIKFNFTEFNNLEFTVYNLKGGIVLQKKVHSGESVAIKEEGLFLYILESSNGLIRKGKLLIKH